MTAVAEQREITALPAYLDLAEPDLDAVVRQLAEDGHSIAVVVPLLFTQAFHATVDVPEAVRRSTESVSLRLVVADILGTGDDVAHVLRDSMAADRIDDHSSVLLFAVGSSNAAANQAGVDLAARLAESRSGPVRACFGTCYPRIADVVDDLPDPVAVVPLFLSEGLLLGPVRELVTQRGWQMTEPLGERAAELVRVRYDSACAHADLR
jgi:sirohydrochlorin cobaltochelatase